MVRVFIVITDGGSNLQSIMLFYILNEIRFRLKTSLLLWFYFGSIAAICLPNVLIGILFNFLDQDVVPSFQNVPIMLFFIMFLFFPINLDIFTRECQLNMLDYLAMNSTRFHEIYLSRIIANAILMVVPLIIGVLSIVLSLVFFIDLSYSSVLLSYLPIIPFFFFCWFLGMLILSIIELKYNVSVIRVLLLYLCLFCLFGLTNLLYVLLITIFNYFEVFTSEIIAYPLLLFLYFFLCGLTFWMLSVIINVRISLTVKNILYRGQEPQKEGNGSQLNFYFLSEVIGSKKGNFGTYLSAIPYIVVYIVSPSSSDTIKSFLPIFSFHFFLLLLYVLFIVFPRITLEKEFNMEELLLSRISAYEYFFPKVFLLLRTIFFPLIVALITIILLSRSFVSFLGLFLSLLLIILYAFYSVSIIVFLWRLFPAKNLLQMILFSLMGYDFFIIFVAFFIFPPFVILLLCSPISSSLIVTSLLTSTNIEGYHDTIVLCLSMVLISTIAFFLGSIILIKADIRYD